MIRQVYAPYTEWEDWKNGMFRNVDRVEFERLKQSAFELLSSPAELLEAMRLAVDQWPIAAAVNLTDRSINHRPWLGQSACCIARRCTEDATRAAWALLNSDLQRNANAQADIVYEQYKEKIDTERQLWLEFAW